MLRNAGGLVYELANRLSQATNLNLTLAESLQQTSQAAV